MIRVLLDANVLISYLLNRDPEGTVPQAVVFALSTTCMPIVPQELVEEVVNSCATKPYLAKHIATRRVHTLIELMAEAGYVPPPLSSLPKPIVRDAKDDYLLAYALIEQAQYLVTGDKDLLILGQVANVQIVTPDQFLIQASEG